ncbi:class IIb bacteriocin, lactobin A/cerein 7B family [Riemerella anatipestifer]|uniref:class IIb bacteriocin, lactobin A/cerein 7B family n=1 Tax=Riemerella anatipestifer TaxID=34085 RepID=UPI001BDB1C71|nr:class IIb bacteriocin, lactobin A/cerein 7B family [Riemerella anatipestifer]MBT0551902.1 class IIb bacteriocin, lactobin A/cerein 7B family [Riemerella anatipestifer]MBT0554014.1 class IIb bacteriocin, lactobin A/cerein 7B family [Riemerella anatipestifer]MCE3024613.1 class IIb bacteriocin, lactobin A/cerein 7B family [Riemerella anatipestifer]MCU7560285.1 class IIb bacteriocin, lactobin A/cerein 7B family [Riemerella anatipestifer]MDY3449629.1 class IIb bacteriocin, lactobin A/cerein 7B f
MNLEKLNLVELDTQQMSETEGGIAPAVIIGIGWGMMTGFSIVGVAIADKYNVKLF